MAKRSMRISNATLGSLEQPILSDIVIAVSAFRK